MPEHWKGVKTGAQASYAAKGHPGSHPSNLLDCGARCFPSGVARLSGWFRSRAQARNAISFVWAGFQALERVCQSHPHGTGSAVTVASGHR